MNKEQEQMCEIVKEKLQENTEDLKSHIIEEKEKINTIHDEIKDIKEDHLVHIEVDMATVRANQEWLMKTYWIIATAAIGGLIVGLFNLLK